MVQLRRKGSLYLKAVTLDVKEREGRQVAIDQKQVKVKKTENSRENIFVCLFIRLERCVLEKSENKTVKSEQLAKHHRLLFHFTVTLIRKKQWII